MSARNSSSAAPSPGGAHDEAARDPGLRVLLTMRRFRRRRSSSVAILRDTPM